MVFASLMAGQYQIVVRSAADPQCGGIPVEILSGRIGKLDTHR